MAELTPAQIAALAPDTQTIARAQVMASPAKWPAGGQDERAVWGQCRGADLYDVAVDRRDLATRCTCPSRRRPCKHALALLMLALGGMVPPGTAPAWVDEWLGERTPKGPRRPPDPEAREKRIAEREAKIAAGLDELERWLDDLLRQGIANAPSRPWEMWDQAAARLVDAQAPGLARRVRALYAAATSGDGWPERVAERVGLLGVLVRAYRGRDALPEPLRAEVRAQIGWTQEKDELLAGDGVRDVWDVLGARVEEDERYRSQRTWLVGRATRQNAVVLAFSAVQAPLDRSLVPGTAVDAELVFYPGAAPVRALVKARGEERRVDAFPGAGVDVALGAWANALARSPFIDSFPMALAHVTPVPRKDGLWLRDARGDGVRIAARFAKPWELVALAGGRPIGAFGEWDGEQLHPLSAWVDGELEEL